MLTVAFVVFALQLLSSATPLEPEPRGLHIPLNKRDPLTDNGVVDLNSVQTSILNTLSKIKNGFEAYKRNTGEDHPLFTGQLIDALDGVLGPTDSSADSATDDSSNPIKRATGSEPLTDDFNGILWQGGISVGTPAHTYTVDYDTGSSDLFLPGPSCTTNCAGHTVYNPTKSTTAVDRKKNYTLRYGDGSSVSGEQYSDTVTIAGLSATGQAVGASNTYSSGFSKSNFPPDGLLGMGYQSISAYNAPPFVQTLIAQKKVTQPVFAFKLAATGSELYIGGVDSSLYTGSFTYAPVTVQGYWQIKMDAVSVNSVQVGKNIQTVVDSGSTLVLGDMATVKALYATVRGSKDASAQYGAGYYTVPCNAIPTVSLTFGGRAFPISPTLFNLGRVSQGSADCVGGVVGTSGLSFWIAGDLFMQNVYTEFDLGNNRVGFATLR